MNKFTPEFRRWFKGSAVVNSDGSPRVVYHGTYDAPAFTEFEFRTELGPHFAVDRGVAAHFAHADDWEMHPEDYPAGRIIPVYLALKNPCRLPDMGQWTSAHAWKSTYGDLVDNLNLPASTAMAKLVNKISKKLHAWDEDFNGVLIRRLLKQEGYDGVIYTNEFESSYDDVDVMNPDYTCYIAFEPQQIKSIFNRRPTMGRTILNPYGY